MSESVKYIIYLDNIISVSLDLLKKFSNSLTEDGKKVKYT